MKILTVLFITFFIMKMTESRGGGIEDFSRKLRILLIKNISPREMRIARERNKLQNRIKKDVPFPCLFLEYVDSDDYKNCNKNKTAVKYPINWKNVKLPRGRSLKPPTSVHKLRPGDIDIVGAIGDSLTAGNGALATNIRQVLTQNRGVSWSIGGQGTWREFLTIPNMLKVYNPNLVGYSLGDSLVFQKAAQFNVAEAAGISEDMVFMTKALISRMNNDPRVDMKNHWKLITYMIGDNDFCFTLCDEKPIEQVLEEHRNDLYNSMKLLKQNLPRTLVQKVVTPSIEILLRFTGKPATCQITHIGECPCFFGEPNKPNRRKYIEAIKEWQRIDEEIINMPEFHDSEDFTIVNQVFTQELEFLTNSKGFTDFTNMSEDCFHFSQKGYSVAVNALWNNMIEPVGKKSKNWKPAFENFVCPTVERPYIATNKNSLPVTKQDYETNFITRKRNVWRK